MPRRWRQVILRAGIATVIAWFIATAPVPRIPAATWFPFMVVPTVIFLLICYIGKLLIDTFFYNRYEP